jgi:hypothetical protein
MNWPDDFGDEDMPLVMFPRLQKSYRSSRFRLPSAIRDWGLSSNQSRAQTDETERLKGSHEH